MQERRTAVRIQRRCRAQYCSSEDLVPRDGRVTTLSEQGVGLLVREAHRAGEMLSIGFSLPGEREALTATGVIRWSAPPREGRWHPIGVNWLQLEETVRSRLQRFLADSTGSASGPAAVTRMRWWSSAAFWTAVIALGLLGAAVFGWRVRRLQQENRQLHAAVGLRDQVIDQLGERGTQLVQELGEAKAHLLETAAEVARLDQQAQAVGAGVARLSEELNGFQASYARVQEERQQLMQQVLELEQERASFVKRLSSVDELRLAIQEAVEARQEAQQQARQAARRSQLQTRRLAAQQRLADGNRGYLIREGQPTIGAGTVWVRVHEPEPIP